jgi:hypothetical protein
MGQLNEGAAKQLKQRLLELECSIAKLLAKDDSFLSPDDAASIRWAMSLARITKVMVAKGDLSKDTNIGHASDRYRALLFNLLSQITNHYGLIDSDGLKAISKKISVLANKERQDLLSIFSAMPKAALDNATRRRPLALTLSGGGGTSYVFIGAFYAMEESGIVPSVIAGSSMGAILGAYRALRKNFDLEMLQRLIENTSWGKVAQAYSGPSRFGIPATFRLYLRDIVGHEFEVNGRFITMSDLAIPLRVCVAGLSAKSPPQEEELSHYAHMLDEKKVRLTSKSIISIIIDFAQKPLKPIYLGGDELTSDFDVLDAIGFSAAIPGIFHYDILRQDSRMINLMNNLFLREGVIRLIDGGFVDNLPTKESIKAVESGACDGYDPFVVSLDGFTPHFNRHLIFYPLMRFAQENSRDGHQASHLSINFKHVLSPINVIPTPDTLRFAIHHGHLEFSQHLPFIRKMIGPIPDPTWL